MAKRRLGFALCGSFCTFSRAIPLLEQLEKDYDIYPILSEHAAGFDTKFGKAADHLLRIETICGRKAILTIPEAEPIGPKRMFDILLVCPCTGNTLAKLASGITDTTVCMAVKSHLRTERPVVLCLATNDALRANAVNIGMLLNRKHYFFVPFGQDDYQNKPSSLVADFSKVPQTLQMALEEKQIQPILYGSANVD